MAVSKAFAKAWIEVDARGAKKAEEEVNAVSKAVAGVGEASEGSASKVQQLVEGFDEAESSGKELTKLIADQIDSTGALSEVIDQAATIYETWGGAIGLAAAGVTGLVLGVIKLNEAMRRNTGVLSTTGRAWKEVTKQLHAALAGVQALQGISGSTDLVGFNVGDEAKAADIARREKALRDLLDDVRGERRQFDHQVRQTRETLERMGIKDGATVDDAGAIRARLDNQALQVNLALQGLELEKQKLQADAAARLFGGGGGGGGGGGKTATPFDPAQFAEGLVAEVERRNKALAFLFEERPGGFAVFRAAADEFADFLETADNNLESAGVYKFFETVAAGDPGLTALEQQLFGVADATYDVAEAFGNNILPQVNAAADGFLRAGLEAAFFGETAAAKINAVADAMLIEASLEATKSGIKAFGAVLIGRPGLAAGFAKEAAMWAALAGTSAAIGAASGGVGASRGGPNPGGFERTDFNRNSEPSGPTSVTYEISQNFGGAIIGRDAGREVKGMLDDYGQSRGSRPARHFRARGA